MEQESSLRLLLQNASDEIGISISTEQVQLFMTYLKQLQLWNQSFNLTAITLGEEIIIKHFIDSLAALKAVSIGAGSYLLDIGTGAGFPGIALKIVRQDLRVTLVEPAHKKSSFLHFIIGLLHLEQVEVFQGTIERFMKELQRIALYDYITTRALSPNVIFQHGKQLLRKDGKAFFYSAKPISRLNYPDNWALVDEYTFELPRGYGSRTVSAFSHLS